VGDDPEHRSFSLFRSIMPRSTAAKRTIQSLSGVSTDADGLAGERLADEDPITQAARAEPFSWAERSISAGRGKGCSGPCEVEHDQGGLSPDL